MIAGVGWIWTFVVISQTFFLGRDGRRGGGCAKPDWDSRADFYPANPPGPYSSAILSDFGHPISLCIHIMASILSIGLGVGVAAFLVCDGISGEFGRVRLN